MSRPSSRNQKTTHSRSNSRRSSLTNTINPHSQQQQPPDPYSFCNSFWGEQGYEVLQNKNRQSTKLLEDLRSWYKERAVIEEDYAKRLTKLTKTPLLEQLSQNNHLEVGGIKRALETVRDTTRQSAHSHLELAGTIRSALEKKLAEFVARRDTLKKNVIHPPLLISPLSATDLFFFLSFLGLISLKPRSNVFIRRNLNW